MSIKRASNRANLPVRSFLSVIACLLACTLTSACVTVNVPSMTDGIIGEGTPTDMNYQVDTYNEVRSSIFCDIEYYSQPSDTVTLRIQPNLVEYIEIKVINGVLYIDSTKNFQWSDETPVLTVSTPSLVAVTISGAGTFTAHDTIASDSFSLRVSGAANATAELDVDKLYLNITGASDNITFSGRADTADILVSGAATINALSLQTRETSIDLSGFGSIKVSCSGSLSINASGAGQIEYRGTPALDINDSGVVDIRQAD